MIKQGLRPLMKPYRRLIYKSWLYNVFNIFKEFKISKYLKTRKYIVKQLELLNLK